MTTTSTTQRLRVWLRRQPLWVRVQELNREGWLNARRRVSYQRQILRTPPMRTGRGPSRVEVRCLTWRRDWMNVLWALKSFYHHAEVDYPLFIHDGGLLPGQAEKILAHFPDATLIGMAEADRRVEELLRGRGLDRCADFRSAHPFVRKLIDMYLLSSAEYIISIDSDVLFFQRPEALLVPPEGLPRNRFNRDIDSSYTLSLDELESFCGIRPQTQINAGLSVIKRDSIDFEAINRWLEHPVLFQGDWLVEQTIHALCATAHGVELLPETYLVSTEPGLPEGLVCKHYPGYFRELFYREGMAQLIRQGFLEALRQPAARAPLPTAAAQA